MFFSIVWSKIESLSLILIQEGKASVPYLISCISIYIEENMIN